MAKGAAAKQEVFAKILEMFPDSFLYNDNKEVRINTRENGEPVQIKITATCAKVMVAEGEDNAIPMAQVEESFPEPVKKTELISPSDEETQSVADLMATLGL